MSADQTCPYCKYENKVFGLYTQGSLMGAPNYTVSCGKCGKRFEAKDEQPKEAAGVQDSNNSQQQ